MRRSKLKKARRRGTVVVTVLTVLAIGGLACLLPARNAYPPRRVDLSPTEMIALRFPDARNDALNKVAEATDTDVSSAQQYSIFSPYPMMAPLSDVPAPASYQISSPDPTTLERPPQAAAPDRDIHPPKVKPAVARTKSPRDTKRPGAVLSDGQIVNIKTRLKLTPDQRQMWPAVQQALRSLSYSSKPQDGASGATRIAEIDPYSDDVRRLKSAAFPLIMSFSDEQKRELRILAYAAGLEKLATQF